jgi:RES domain
MSAAAAADMHLIPPPRGPLFHVGRRPNPFSWRMPDPLDLTADPPIIAGSRFDAPNGDYATLYCATERYGALLEKLSPLRPIPELRARIDQALPGDREPEHDRMPGSTPFPTDIFEALQMGLVSIDAEALFVDVDNPETHAALEKYGGKPLLQELGVSRIDRGTFLSPDRGLTRRAAHELHELVSGFAIGLRYTSALDGAAECWAIWDHGRPRLCDHDVEPVDASSPDLMRALPRLGFKPPA